MRDIIIGEEMLVLGFSFFFFWGLLVSVVFLIVFFYVVIKLILVYLDYLSWVFFYIGLFMDFYVSKFLGYLLMVFI